ncbi:HNH endonuclease [Pontibacter toksunensis]|uniref:HNH endonuclease n=1 Tax=Pontibacter toksunensis TaxID=1332631 RepID=A0ABW6BZ58_9BACT
MVKLWRRCSVTDSNLIEILVASHIKPWRESNNRERLDLYKGLLLTPDLDSLFDKGLINFGDDGAIMLPKKLSKQACNILNLTTNIKLRHVFEQNLPYLRFHRESIFQR